MMEWPTTGDADVEVFADGNMAQVVRRDDSVFRAPGPWAGASRQVLRHLEAVGFPLAPRLVATGRDEDELGFILGKSIAADLHGHEDEAWLSRVGAAIRELHDAMAGFAFALGTVHVEMDLMPDSPTIVCHCDLAPWNTIVDGDRVTGIIDWDLVAPGTREWDLAYAAWRFAPVYPEGRTGFTPIEQARRIVRLLDAYGLPTAGRAGLVDLILRRQRSAVGTVARLGRMRVPGFSRLLDEGLHLSGIDDRLWLERHVAEFRRIIEGSRR